MIEYKKMNNKELASVIVGHMDRLNALRELDSLASIQSEYKKLKAEIKEIAHYCDLKRNENDEDVIYVTFCSNYLEANAHGFIEPVNSRNKVELLNSVEEAEYKLSKHFEWKDFIK
jgi:hypothetical protein